MTIDQQLSSAFEDLTKEIGWPTFCIDETDFDSEDTDRDVRDKLIHIISKLNELTRTLKFVPSKIQYGPGARRNRETPSERE